MNKLTVRDIFKFMVIIAIFFIYAGGPYIFSKGEGDLYGMTILAWPGPALYCGIVAMIISRVSSRWFLDQHYRAMDGAQRAYHRQNVGVISSSSVPGTANESMDATVDTPYGLTGSSEREMGVSEEFDDDEDVPSEILIQARRSVNLCGRRILLGDLGMALGVFTVLLLIIVALIYVPAVSIDLSSIAEIILESGTTYEQAISQFGVYAFICAVLLKARLALEAVSDYVAVVLLLVVGMLALCFVWFVGVVRLARDVHTNGWRRLYPTFFEKNDNSNLSQLPSYLKLYAHRYSTVYVVAYVIGIFQLGAVTIYAIHYFCNLLDLLYAGLAFIGLITSTSGQCWEEQMGQPHNLVVLFGCFAYLTFCFIEQLTLQYKFNVEQATKMLKWQQLESTFLEGLDGGMKKDDVKPVSSAESKLRRMCRDSGVTMDYSDASHAEHCSSANLYGSVVSATSSIYCRDDDLNSPDTLSESDSPATIRESDIDDASDGGDISDSASETEKEDVLIPTRSASTYARTIPSNNQAPATVDCDSLPVVCSLVEVDV